jgi:hypothetical protein
MKQVKNTIHKILFSSVSRLRIILELCVLVRLDLKKNFGKLVFLEVAAEEREQKRQFLYINSKVINILKIQCTHTHTHTHTQAKVLN